MTIEYKREVKSEYYLKFGEEEARYLKAVMQNCLHGDLNDEPQDQRDIRLGFFKAVADARST